MLLEHVARKIGNMLKNRNVELNTIIEKNSFVKFKIWRDKFMFSSSVKTASIIYKMCPKFLQLHF